MPAPGVEDQHVSGAVRCGDAAHGVATGPGVRVDQGCKLGSRQVARPGVAAGQEAKRRRWPAQLASHENEPGIGLAGPVSTPSSRLVVEQPVLQENGPSSTAAASSAKSAAVRSAFGAAARSIELPTRSQLRATAKPKAINVARWPQPGSAPSSGGRRAGAAGSVRTWLSDVDPLRVRAATLGYDEGAPRSRIGAGGAPRWDGPMPRHRRLRRERRGSARPGSARRSPRPWTTWRSSAALRTSTAC